MTPADRTALGALVAQLAADRDAAIAAGEWATVRTLDRRLAVLAVEAIPALLGD